jgi:hypothetical protein
MALYRPNQAEPILDPLSKVVVHTHIALQHCGIVLAFPCSVWESERREQDSFSWLAIGLENPVLRYPPLELCISPTMEN